MSEGLFTLIEWMTANYKIAVDKPTRTDGIPLKRLAARYRRELKDKYACTMAAGFGSQLRAAGHYYPVTTFSRAA